MKTTLNLLLNDRVDSDAAGGRGGEVVEKREICMGEKLSEKTPIKTRTQKIDV